MKITKTRLQQIIKEEVSRYAYSGIEEAGGGQAYDVFETLKEQLGPETLLDELYQAMSSDEAMANFEHIARMHNINLGLDDDDDGIDSDLYADDDEDDVPFEETARLSPDVVPSKKREKVPPSKKVHFSKDDDDGKHHSRRDERPWSDRPGTQEECLDEDCLGEGCKGKLKK